MDFNCLLPSSLEKHDLHKLLEETIILVAFEMEAQGISVEKNFQKRMPYVAVDGEQMKQVFLNVILNAMQAMPRGGKLIISTFQNSSPGGKEEVGISFQDTGEGISAEIREKIFEPFFSTKEEGLGLGLPIGQRIIEEHKGRIEIVSYPKRGTAFYIYLPIQ